MSTRRLGARTIVSALVLAAGVSTYAAGSEATPAGYLPPMAIEGSVFPLARSDWFSVINFQDDWHAPRMRWVAGRWVAAGVHEGTDILAEPGTPVRSMTPGRIENLGWLFYSGWRVGVRGNDGRYYFYAHMSRFASGLGIGDGVASGDIIGFVGNTGYGRAGHHDEFTYHLHVGIQEPGGTWSNPFPTLRSIYRATVEKQS